MKTKAANRHLHRVAIGRFCGMQIKGNAKMEVKIEKIWEAVDGLREADDQITATCYSIINMMIHQGIVTRKEATRQIEKSVTKVVALHRQIADAMHAKALKGERGGVVNSVQ